MSGLYTNDQNLTYATYRGATISTGPLTAITITIPTNKTVILESRVVGRRTGGSAGATGDSAGYIRVGTYKNIAGTITLVGVLQATYTVEDQVAWNHAQTISGTTVQMICTGALNNNVDWDVTVIYQEVF